jgi:hypothetical protein
LEKLIYIHFGLMGLAAVLIIIAAAIAHKKGEGWFKRHRSAALAGALCALLAFASIVAFKISVDFPHFKSPHAIAGLIGAILIVITPVTGILMVKGKASLRPVHRVLGKITAGLAVLVAVSGVLRFLQISKGK